jgi:hypothetical protein
LALMHFAKTTAFSKAWKSKSFCHKNFTKPVYKYVLYHNSQVQVNCGFITAFMNSHAATRRAVL